MQRNTDDVENYIQDQSQICWNDVQWLQMNPLNEQTVLDYFARSVFYDTKCNNEKIRMQGLSLVFLK
jgi:hypothetical protein